MLWQSLRLALNKTISGKQDPLQTIDIDTDEASDNSMTILIVLLLLVTTGASIYLIKK
jgi:hypothetical protein